jgi:hypothetical protein
VFNKNLVKSIFKLTWLFYICSASFDEILDDFSVAVSAAKHQRSGAVRFGGNQLSNFFARSVVKKYLKLYNTDLLRK